MRDVLVERVREALRQLGLRRVDIVDGDLGIVDRLREHDLPTLAFLGPSCYAELEGAIKNFRARFPVVPLAAILEQEIYASEAVELRKRLSVRMIPVADIGQMAQFIVESGDRLGVLTGGLKSRGVIAVTQLKGGVGTSTVAPRAACV